MAGLNERGGRRNPLLQTSRAAQSAAVVREDEPTLIRVTSGGEDRQWYLRVKLSAKTAAALCRDEATAREAMVWHSGGWSPVLQVPELYKAITAQRADSTRSGVTAASPARLSVAPPPASHRLEAAPPPTPSGKRGWQPRLLPAPPAEGLPATPSSRPPPPPMVVAPGALRAAGQAAALLPPAAPSAAPPMIPPAGKLPNIQQANVHRSNGFRTHAHQEVTTSDVHSLAPIQRSPSPETASSSWAARVGYMMAGALLVSGVFWIAGLRSALPEASAPDAAATAPDSAVKVAKPAAQAPETPDIPRVALSALPSLPKGAPAPTTLSAADETEPGADEAEAADEAAPSADESAPKTKARRAHASASRRATAARSKKKAHAKAPAPQKKPEPSDAASRSRAEPSDSSGSFNASAARLALRSAASRAGSCANGKASGTAVVTFAPWGGVTSVSIANLDGANVRPGCVTRIFRSARVPPFSGDAVTVSKSFRVR